jgi:hypothetical protein
MDVDVIVDPFKDFVTIIFEYLPRIVYAIALVIVAWIVARVARFAVRKALRAGKVDERIDKEATAIRDTYPVADGVASAVYWLIWLLFLPVVLGVLGFGGLLDPVEGMLSKILGALPNILAAVVVLAVAYFVGRLLAALVTNFLTRVRFNEVPVKLRLAEKAAEGEWTPSSIVGYLVLIVVMLFGLMMAANLLNFSTVNDLVSQFTVFFGKVILGVVILGIGIFLAGLVSKLVQATGKAQAGMLATVAQVFIIFLAAAIALRTMGFANDLILLGFGLLLAAVAVAVALAFGLGGRDVARDQLDRWAKSIRGEKSDKS